MRSTVLLFYVSYGLLRRTSDLRGTKEKIVVLATLRISTNSLLNVAIIFLFAEKTIFTYIIL
jgi:hypothetical protein